MKEEKIKEQKLPNPPWLDLRLTKEVIDHLWEMINQQGPPPSAGSVLQRQASYGGPNNKVNDIVDFTFGAAEWFFEDVLKKYSEQLYYKDWNNYYNVHIGQSVPPPVFELKEMWVNHQKQHEYIPPHKHWALFSFVVFMKIPTHWKEQQALPWLKNVEESRVSDFQFILGTGMGPVQEIPIPLCTEDEGRMLFFPAWLTHQVFPFYECEKERITISGNIIPKINVNT